MDSDIAGQVRQMLTALSEFDPDSVEQAPERVRDLLSGSTMDCYHGKFAMILANITRQTGSKSVCSHNSTTKSSVQETWTFAVRLHRAFVRACSRLASLIRRAAAAPLSS